MPVCFWTISFLHLATSISYAFSTLLLLNTFLRLFSFWVHVLILRACLQSLHLVCGLVALIYLHGFGTSRAFTLVRHAVLVGSPTHLARCLAFTPLHCTAAVLSCRLRHLYAPRVLRLPQFVAISSRTLFLFVYRFALPLLFRSVSHVPRSFFLTTGSRVCAPLVPVPHLHCVRSPFSALSAPHACHRLLPAPVLTFYTPHPCCTSSWVGFTLLHGAALRITHLHSLLHTVFALGYTHLATCTFTISHCILLHHVVPASFPVLHSEPLFLRILRFVPLAFTFRLRCSFYVPSPSVGYALSTFTRPCTRHYVTFRTTAAVLVCRLHSPCGLRFYTPYRSFRFALTFRLSGTRYRFRTGFARTFSRSCVLRPPAIFLRLHLVHPLSTTGFVLVGFCRSRHLCISPPSSSTLGLSTFLCIILRSSRTLFSHCAAPPFTCTGFLCSKETFLRALAVLPHVLHRSSRSALPPRFHYRIRHVLLYIFTVLITLTSACSPAGLFAPAVHVCVA